MEMTSYAKAKSNLCTLNDATTEKQSLNLFFCLPQKYMQKPLKRHRGQTRLVARLDLMIYQVK